MDTVSAEPFVSKPGAGTTYFTPKCLETCAAEGYNM